MMRISFSNLSFLVLHRLLVHVECPGWLLFLGQIYTIFPLKFLLCSHLKDLLVFYFLYILSLPNPISSFLSLWETWVFGHGSKDTDINFFISTCERLSGRSFVCMVQKIIIFYSFPEILKATKSTVMQAWWHFKEILF